MNAPFQSHSQAADFSLREGGSDKTKYRLARAAKDCMAASGTDGLTVTQIVRACGVTRQTFYRNFADKYALINWYFDKLLLESFARMGDGLTIREGLERKFEFIHRERLFFANAFRSDGQNALREHDYELILQFYTDLIRKKTGRRPAEDLLFCLKLYCRGSIHMTVDWILSPDKRTPARMAALLTEAMPRKLAELFASLGLL